MPVARCSRSLLIPLKWKEGTPNYHCITNNHIYFNASMLRLMHMLRILFIVINAAALLSGKFVNGVHSHLLFEHLET
jgi:hypothetical protein